MSKVFLILISIILSGCSSLGVYRNHGSFVSSQKLDEIKVGEIGKEGVTAVLGEPQLIPVTNESSWIYFGEQTRQIAFLDPKILSRQIVVISFNKDDIVNKVDTYDLKNAKSVRLEKKTTPALTKTPSALKQILGNIGKTY